MKMASALALSLTLAGCTVFPVPEPPRFMDLAPADTVPAFSQTVPASLRVDTPLASDPLDSSSILIKPSAYEYQAISGARWRESMPVVIRDHLIQAFRASGGFANVMTATSPATSALTLISELSGFHAEDGANGTRVVINLHLQLMDNRTRQSLCVTNYQARTDAGSARLEDLMQAFSDVAEEATSATMSWAHRCMAEA